MPAISQHAPVQENHRGAFSISTDRTRLDLDVIHSFLTESYWAREISYEVVARSIENSLCFGVYRGEQQVGFARAKQMMSSPHQSQIGMEHGLSG